MQEIRRINLGGGFTGDSDWTIPSNAPPAAAKRLRATSNTMKFALVGRASTADGAAQASLGSMTVDAWLGLEVGGGMARHASVSEAAGEVGKAQVVLVEMDCIPGQVYRLNISALASVTAAAVWVYVLSGGNPL
jgi:hypothetical protein